MFFIILIIGITLVFLQGFFSFRDGYLTQMQMHKNGVYGGYSFMEHGGMWADVFIISPIIAYLTSNYSFNYTALSSIIIFSVVFIITLVAGKAYSKKATTVPEAHVHNGEATIAGWIHGIYALIGLYYIITFYFTDNFSPRAGNVSIIIIAMFLCVFFPLGVMKFNKRWEFSKSDKIQLLIEYIILGAITVIKLM